MIAPANSLNAGTPSLREFLVHAAQERLRRRRKLLLRCLDDFSEEVVHATRVNTRRLLAQLELIEPLLPVDVIADARQALRKELKALAALRDIQVQLAHVETMLPKHRELKLFRLHLRRRERRAIRAANKKLSRRKNARRIARLEEALAALSSAKGLTSRRAFSSHVSHALHDAFATIIRLQRRAASKPKWLHRMRLALKRYRYMAESLPYALSEVTAQRLGVLQAHQRRTGEIHDLALLERRLQKFIDRTGDSRGLDACRKAWGRRRSAREHAHIELTPSILAQPVATHRFVPDASHPVPRQPQRNNCQIVRSNHPACG